MMGSGTNTFQDSRRSNLRERVLRGIQISIYVVVISANHGNVHGRGPSTNESPVGVVLVGFDFGHVVSLRCA